MSAAVYLAQLGVSVAQAQQFISANLSSPQVIYDTCKAYGITNDMLGELYAVSGADVIEVFAGLGVNSVGLDEVGLGEYHYEFSFDDALFSSSASLPELETEVMPDWLTIEEVDLAFSEDALSGVFSLKDIVVDESAKYSIIFDFNGDFVEDLSFNFTVLDESTVSLRVKSSGNSVAISSAVLEQSVDTQVDLLENEIRFSIDTPAIIQYWDAIGSKSTAISAFETYSETNLAAFSAQNSRVMVESGEILQVTDTAYYLI